MFESIHVLYENTDTKTEDPAAEHESTDSIIARVEVQRWLLEMASSVLISDRDRE